MWFVPPCLRVVDRYRIPYIFRWPHQRLNWKYKGLLVLEHHSLPARPWPQLYIILEPKSKEVVMEDEKSRSFEMKVEKISFSSLSVKHLASLWSLAVWCSARALHLCTAASSGIFILASRNWNTSTKQPCYVPLETHSMPSEMCPCSSKESPNIFSLLFLV